MKEKRFPKAWLMAAAVVTLLGIVFWIYQLFRGLGATGMSDMSSWGLYITMFMFFVGLSAGGLIVASSAHVFNIERFKKLALPAVIVSTVCICVAGIFVLVDLGSIQRIYNLVIHPQVASPLLWDLCVITLYIIINILDIVWIARGAEENVHKLSFVALPVAILVHSVTAWIFGLQIARSWFTAILAPIFIASACDSGLALLLLCLMLLEARGLFSVGEELFKSLSGLLAIFVAVDFYLICCELLTMGYPGAGEAAALHVMATGATAPFFWFEIVCGIIVPFVILAMVRNRENKRMVAIASVLVVLGVLCKRVWLLFTAFATPVATGSSSLTSSLAPDALSALGLWAVYLPTIPELVIVLGVLALGFLAFMAMSTLLLDEDADRSSVGAAIRSVGFTPSEKRARASAEQPTPVEGAAEA